jgi:hypothetical protein
MFTGHHPFHHLKMDFMVYLAVQKGERPERPLHDPHPTRGLSDEVWHLVQSCWVSERPVASLVVEQLGGLCNQLLDARLLDSFNLSFSSQLVHSSIGSPFSTLTTVGTAA